MTLKTKRELTREVDQINDRVQETDDGLFPLRIACEHDDGTYTDPEGNPLPADAEVNLTVSWEVAQTWPGD
mgnify:FL=1|jgi:hypothetical protein